MDPHIAALSRARELAAANQTAQAREVLTRVLRREPHHPPANAAMAFVALREGQGEQAAYYAGRALDLAPPGSELYVEAAKLLGHAGRRDRAIAALASVPTDAPAAVLSRLALSHQYLASRRPAAAARAASEGLALDPSNPELGNNLALARSHAGRSSQAAQTLRQAVRQHPSNLVLLSNLALTLNYCEDAAPADTLAAHQAFGRALSAQVPLGTPPALSPEPERPLHVGFLSPDFVAHSVERFIAPVCEGLDPGCFRVTCFSTAAEAAQDAGRRPRVADYRCVATLDDEALAADIRGRGIDILVELSGHTMGARLGVLQRRPAPVQATYLGYPNTTGVAAVDWRLVDALTDPFQSADRFATERLVRLDPCFLCFRPPPAPEVRPRPNGGITFGSFNAAAKISDETVRMWSGVLRAVPGSRLVLKNWGLGEAETRNDMAGRFAAEGVEPTRLELLGWSNSTANHLAEYHRIDVALDTYPYHGTTTTAEALWMGVPVVSRVGEVHAARVGLSLLTAAGVPEGAAMTHADFIARAAALAQDLRSLAALRVGLRRRVRSSLLCDSVPMGRRFGDALRTMWREWCIARST